MKKLVAALLALTCTFATAVSLVGCKKEERGTLTVDTVYAWVGYPAVSFFPTFSDEAYKEELTYEYDASGITVDAATNTVTALKAGVYDVVAKSEHFEVTFQVKAERVDKSTTKYITEQFENAAANRKAQWQERGNAGQTTLFIGDSFFDLGFWSNFYTSSYVNKDALCLGISSTTSYDWETWATGWLAETAPKSIVMHIGTNNIYDDLDSADGAISALRRLFTVLHTQFPETHIYWFGISQRDHDEAKIQCVSEVNASMKRWCDALSFITYIDTPALLKNDMLRDGVHPKVEYYKIFVDELAKTNITIRNSRVTNQSAEVQDLVFSTSQRISDSTGLSSVLYKGTALTKNYVLSGRLEITKKTTNAHIQFGVLDSGDNRILLWDHASNGQFKLCIPYDTNVPEEDIYTLKSSSKPIVIDWKIVYHGNNVYFFIDEELKLVYTALNNIDAPLVLGSEGAACSFYNMRAVTLAENPAEYQQNIDSLYATISPYVSITTSQKIRV